MGEVLNRKVYISIFAVAIIVIVASIVVYMNQLAITVSNNLMATVDEISEHDVESVEGTLENSYAVLGSVAKRMDIYDIDSMEEVQERLNLEMAASEIFNALYLIDSNGDLYGSSYLRVAAADHAYDEMIAQGAEHFVVLYDEENGTLETLKESLIFGIKLDDMVIGDRTFVAMLGRTDLSSIRNQLLIESFNGQGRSSVVNKAGYYVVGETQTSDITRRDNFFNMLEAGHIADGVTVGDVRESIIEGRSFVINFESPGGEDLIISFKPIDGTVWSFVLAVSADVFSQNINPLLNMTAVMLIVVGMVIIIMMILVYRFMKRSVLARAESAARAEFLSNMSHEIRTPLNGIVGLNHLMERNLDNREAMEGYVYKLDKAAQYLLALVNDILDVSKLQAGKVELVSEPFNLMEAIQNVWEIQREPMAEKNIVFNTTAVKVDHPYLMGDEIRISQVLMNILSNAVKFTPEEGTITFEALQHYNATNDNVTTAISIADTGCGMTKDFVNNIFDAFTQERNSNSESQKGTGLGMAISYLLVQEMGGRIDVESALGKGSRFSVSFTLPVCHAEKELSLLPVEGAVADDELREQGRVSVESDAGSPGDGSGDASATAFEHASADAAQIAPMKLLIAEDNELNADILYSILTGNGYDVSVAVNGQEAVDIFNASAIGEFAAILMDAQMPVMDGYEAVKEIRNLDRTDAKNVRIFACTASTFTEDRNRALEAGMDDFLTKPLNVPIMLKKLEQLRDQVDTDGKRTTAKE